MLATDGFKLDCNFFPSADVHACSTQERSPRDFNSTGFPPPPAPIMQCKSCGEKCTLTQENVSKRPPTNLLGQPILFSYSELHPGNLSRWSPSCTKKQVSPICFLQKDFALAHENLYMEILPVASSMQLKSGVHLDQSGTPRTNLRKQQNPVLFVLP